MAAILTFRQYVSADRARVVAEYGVRPSEVARLYPDHAYTAAWWRYVVESFGAGEDFTPQGLATLSAGQLRDLSRTSRALRNNEDARTLAYAGARLHG